MNNGSQRKVIAEVDPFPISELRNRYGIGKQTDINRRNYFGIVPFSEKGKNYISLDDLRKLDALDEFLQTPGRRMEEFKLEEFVEEEDYRELTRSESQSFGAVGMRDFEGLVRAIASVVSPPNPLQYMEVLERAAEMGWVLTTSEVESLIGVKPRVRKGSDTFTRGCWLFVKRGKIGSQTAWIVRKEMG